jgi:hypothetical protein
MMLTLEFLNQKFDELNELCFGGALPKVSIRLSKARTYLGQLGFKRKRPLFGKTQYYDFVLRISTRLEQTEEEIIDTLLHEMIHLYIASHQLKDSSSHGKVFRQMMNDLNQRFGRHITISHRKTKDELNQDTQRRQHLVCVSTLASGERGITIAAKSRLLLLWDQIPRIPEIVSQTWYVSYDPYFNRFPRALTPKVYRISPSDLDLHLKAARPLVRQGRKIFIATTCS